MDQGLLYVEDVVETTWRATMIRTVIVDLDGTILDGRFRHYACYRQILEERGYAPVSLESYWRMKLERADRRQQLAASGAEAIHEDFSTLGWNKSNSRIFLPWIACSRA